MNQEMTASQLADKLEFEKMTELNDRILYRSPLYKLGDGKIHSLRPGEFGTWPRRRQMGEDPRLPKLPEKPTLMDFINLRFEPGQQQHLLQSAALAEENGHPEKIVLACLLHDISVCGFLRPDHGYWGAQLIEPYVDEEVSWAIRMHQCMRFFADESVGYPYPETYIKMFGEDYTPEPYIHAEYERAKKHKWYMSGRLICLYDLDSFDADNLIEWERFEDLIGRNVKQPPEGLGNDNTPSSHMWRTIRWPANAL